LKREKKPPAGIEPAISRLRIKTYIVHNVVVILDIYFQLTSFELCAIFLNDNSDFNRENRDGTNGIPLVPL